MKVTILGSGPSGGVPSTGIGWGRCDPDNPKNRRLRPSILVEHVDSNGKPGRVLIDTSPDLRAQLLAAEVTELDAVIYTHAHSDHINGIDDLRGINRAMNQPLDAYGDEQTLGALKTRFGYAFEPLNEQATHYYKPTLTAKTLIPGEDMVIVDKPLRCFEQDHGFSTTLGLRYGDLAYTTDLVDLTDEAFEVLEGTTLWIIGVLTDQPHPTHVHVGKALKWIERIKPERAVLSHLGLGLDYATLMKQLPEGVVAAYDGLVLSV